jgi:hypothetical protein
MSRYGQPLPTINKNYMSAILSRQSGDTYSSYDTIQTPNNEAVRSNVVVEVGKTTSIFSNPVPTENFNVISVSVDTMNGENGFNDNYEIKLKQGLASTSLSETFVSPILSKTNFYRNYPVANNFINLELFNPTENTSNLHANVVITLSKYTQFNPPTQLGDGVEYKSMANLAREGNIFIDDVSRQLIDGVELINIQGMVNEVSANVHVVSPIEFSIPTSNVYTEVYVQSDSPSDNFEIFLSGNTDLGSEGRITNGLFLLGTSPSVISINRFKSIDTIDFNGNVNTGNISVYTNGTNLARNYCPAGWANTAAAVYYINKRSVGVLKYIEVNGYSTLHVSRIRAVIQDESTGQKTVWESRIADGDIQRLWSPDLQIPSNHTLYVEMDGHSPLGSDQEINVNFKILQYSLHPSREIS